MRVSGPLSLQQQAPVSRQDEPPDRNELCVCKQQAGGQREASQGRRGGQEGEMETMREERENARQNKEGMKEGEEGELIFIHSKPRLTTGSSAWIDTFPHRRS